MNKQTLCCLLGLFVSTLPAGAAIVYDPAGNTITVSDFAESGPCTLRALLQSDTANRWGKVSYDQATDTYTVGANLAIGKNDGTATHFQIGSREHPRETLVMKGNICVCPSFVSGVNSDLEWTNNLVKQGKPVPYNRLTLGVPGDSAVKPALKIEAQHPGMNNQLLIGMLYPGTKQGYRAQFFAYHSLVGTEEANPSRWIDSFSYGEIRLLGSTVSGFRKSFFFGARGDWLTVADCVFTNSIYGVVNMTNVCRIRTSTFRACSCALGDWGGALNLELIGCTLEGNETNWFLRRGTVLLIDCTVAKSRKSDFVGDSLERKERPEVIALRQAVVQVTDAAGKPVPGAVVMAVPEQDDISLKAFKTRTGADGKTPGPGSDATLLLRDYRVKGTGDPDQPERSEYSYEITVEASGRKTKTMKSVKVSDPRPVITVVLED